MYYLCFSALIGVEHLARASTRVPVLLALPNPRITLDHKAPRGHTKTSKDRKEKPMSLTLNLEPEVEQRVRDYATDQNLSIEELIARTFPPRWVPSPPAQRGQGQVPDALSPAVSSAPAVTPRKAPRLQVLPREQAITLNAASIQRLKAELAEGANATPEEAAQAEAEWQEFRQALNDNRRRSGEPLLFPENPSPPVPQP